VDRLLAETRATPWVDLPDWVDEPFEPQRLMLRGLEEEERRVKQRELQRIERERRAELQAWWYREMVETPSPLTERMTLFWHNHFVSSLQKVRVPKFMAEQNMLFRRNALGNFRLLTHYVAKDPAMIRYLDSGSNVKGKPNENFARELLELFTLGEGHYTEQDIKEAARAFTGWGVNPQGVFAFRRNVHDYEVKAFMGRYGDFNGAEIIDIVMENDRTAPYIVGKLWLEFISDSPDEKEVARLAAVFRESGYEIKSLMRALLNSPHFRDPANYGALIKSPADLMVGMIRTFGIGIEPDSYGSLVREGRQLGQELMNPPNVKGWPGGTAWIDSNTLLSRRSLLEGLIGEATLALQKETVAERMKQRREAALSGGDVEMAMAGEDLSGGPVMDDSMMQSEMAEMRPRNRRARGNAMRMTMNLGGWLENVNELGFSTRDLSRLLLAQPPIEEMAWNAPAFEQIRVLLMDPVYQLK
jgi:uncharacterized protein (DUF1800 family)